MILCSTVGKRYTIAAVLLAVLLVAGGVYITFFTSPPKPPPIPVPPDIHVPVQHIPPPANPLPVYEGLFVTFSHDAGFYNAGFYLTLYAPEDATIFFTLDGSYPGIRSQRFKAPIYVTAPAPELLPVSGMAPNLVLPISQVTLFTIRAVAVRATELGKEASEIVTRNFVMGTDVHRRFAADMLIFALTSDPHGLFDHYEGIMVAGIDRQRWREDFYRQHGRWPRFGYGGADESPASPANFNRRGPESERAAHVEVFDHTGQLHISQRIGIRVRGGFSRAHEPQKSLDLIAREIYGDRETFAFAFFDDEFDAQGNLIDRYGRVRLRNGGTDRYNAFVRDELSQSLFRQAGQPTTQNHRPAAVFLNGEFYGAAWVKSPRRPGHLRRIYGGESERFEIIQGGDRAEHAWWSGDNRAAVADFQQIHRLAIAGFTGSDGEERFREFSQRVDVDALIRYYAMQIFINNLDWPNHNFELWRYFPTEEEKNDPTLHPYLRDGRWRPFVHDVEAGWGYGGNSEARAREDTLYHILTRTGDRWNSGMGSAFLNGFVAREDTRAALANAFVDLIEYAFAPDNVIYTLNNLIGQIETEHNHAILTNAIRPYNPYWPSIDSVANNRDNIRRFARQRPEAIMASVERNLGVSQDERFRVELYVGDGGTAMMHLRPVSDTAAGNYFAGTQIKITALPQAGNSPSWTVNGTDVSPTDYIIIYSDAQVILRFRGAI